MARDINIVLNGYTITDFYNASSPVDPTAQDSFVVNICDGVNCVQQSITQNIYIDNEGGTSDAAIISFTKADSVVGNLRLELVSEALGAYPLTAQGLEEPYIDDDTSPMSTAMVYGTSTINPNFEFVEILGCNDRSCFEPSG